MIQQNNTTITNRTNGRPYIKGLPFDDIKSKILGKKYELSLVFIEDKYSKQLNKKYRNKNKPTNVLAFPISDIYGEIFINVDSIKREYLNFTESRKQFIGYLFIHSLFHLKGYSHGSKMEKEEKIIRDKFL